MCMMFSSSRSTGYMLTACRSTCFATLWYLPAESRRQSDPPFPSPFFRLYYTGFHSSSSVCVLAVCNISRSTRRGTAGLTICELSTSLSFVTWVGALENIPSCNHFQFTVHLDCCLGLRRPPLSSPLAIPIFPSCSDIHTQLVYDAHDSSS